MNKIELMAAISRNLGDLVMDGTVSTSNVSRSIFYDTALVAEVDNQFKGHFLYLHTFQTVGVDGEAVVVKANVVGSNSIEVVPSFSMAVPTLGDGYYMTKRFDRAAYDGVIDAAVRRVREYYLIPFAASLSMVASQWSYPVPSGFKYINELVMVPTGHTDYSDALHWRPLFPDSWSVKVNPAGSYMIELDPRLADPDMYDSGVVMVRGQRRPVSLTGVTINVEGGEVVNDFIIHYAAMELANRRITDDQEFVQKFHNHRRIAEGLLPKLRTHVVANSRKVQD